MNYEMSDFAETAGDDSPVEDNVAAVCCIAFCAAAVAAGGISFYILMELLR